MATKQEGFYDDDGRVTKRGNKATDHLGKAIIKVFLKAKSPRECRDLERILNGDVSIACSLRVMHFQMKKFERKGKKRGIRR